MSELRFQRVGAGKAQIGLLISRLDPDRVYLAIPIEHYPSPQVGLFIDSAAIEVQEDDQNLTYAAIPWTPEFDERWVMLIDLMIQLRQAHPTMVQLRLFDPLLVEPVV